MLLVAASVFATSLNILWSFRHLAGGFTPVSFPKSLQPAVVTTPDDDHEKRDSTAKTEETERFQHSFSYSSHGHFHGFLPVDSGTKAYYDI